MTRNRNEIEAELQTLRADIKAELDSEAWAYDYAAEENLRKKRLCAVELERELILLTD